MSRPKISSSFTVLPLLFFWITNVLQNCDGYNNNPPLPPPSSKLLSIPKELEYLSTNGMLVRPHPNLYVLGTVHIGSKSAQDVELLMETVKPSTLVVEVSPSRLQRIQTKIRNSSSSRSTARSTSRTNNQTTIHDTEDSNSKSNNNSKQMDIISALGTLPSLAKAGYEKGGISGFFFAIIIVWSSLVKRSMTTNEEEQVLPRINEFEAGIEFAEKQMMETRNTVCIEDENDEHTRNDVDDENDENDVKPQKNQLQQNIKIIPADIEFDTLLQSVANNMKFQEWIQLGFTILGEMIGLLPNDPIRRKQNESIVEWEDRRRDITVARASRIHGDTMTPYLAKVLVEERDDEFACICWEEICNICRIRKKEDAVIVCLVGLVHVDGIVSRIQKRINLQINS